MTARRSQDALHELADALSLDILDTPGTELLGEVAEDAGHPDALVAEFDTLFASALQQYGHEETENITQKAPRRRLLAEAPKSLLGRLRTWWQDHLTMFPGLVFPNRFAMTGLCSAFLVIIAVTVAVKNPELMSNAGNSPPNGGQIPEEPGPPPTTSVGKNPAAQHNPAPLEQPHVTAPMAAPAPRSLETPSPITPALPIGIPATPGRRIALVVGNGNYAALPRLATPANGAHAMAIALMGLGFDVSLGVDLPRSGLDELIGKFAGDARTADTALVYYAGHGVQFQGENYLVGVDFRPDDMIDPRQLVGFRSVVDAVQNARQTRILLMDACRDNGLPGSLLAARSASAPRGLAQERGGVGTMVVYADQPGHIASDGSEPDSAFTAALLRNLAAPGVELRTMMSRVRADVVATTGGKQRPSVTDSMAGEFIFKAAH